MEDRSEERLIRRLIEANQNKSRNSRRSYVGDLVVRIDDPKEERKRSMKELDASDVVIVGLMKVCPPPSRGIYVLRWATGCFTGA